MKQKIVLTHNSGEILYEYTMTGRLVTIDDKLKYSWILVDENAVGASRVIGDYPNPLDAFEEIQRRIK